MGLDIWGDREEGAKDLSGMNTQEDGGSIPRDGY